MYPTSTLSVGKVSYDCSSSAGIAETYGPIYGLTSNLPCHILLSDQPSASKSLSGPGFEARYDVKSSTKGRLTRLSAEIRRLSEAPESMMQYSPKNSDRYQLETSGCTLSSVLAFMQAMGIASKCQVFRRTNEVALLCQHTPNPKRHLHKAALLSLTHSIDLSRGLHR